MAAKPHRQCSLHCVKLNQRHDLSLPTHIIYYFYNSLGYIIFQFHHSWFGVTVLYVPYMTQVRWNIILIFGLYNLLVSQ